MMYWSNRDRPLSVLLPKKQVIFLVFLICLLCCIIPVHAEPTPHKNGQFKFATVTVVVKDINGEAVKGAEVKAFSEDWGVMYPHSEEVVR